MAEFVIKMADERGHVLQQMEHGRSEAEIRERFSQQGFHVFSVKPRGILAGGGVARRRRVKMATFVVFNEQFLTLVHAGLPIVSALDLLIRRQKNKNFAGILDNVRERVKGGELLSDAFAAQGVFPKIYSTTLLAGEKSGNLEEVLSRYLAFQRLTMSFTKKLKASLVYPALLFVLVLCMLSFLITYVVPRFGELFSTLHAQLPPMTEFMLSLGAGAQHYFWYIVIGLAVLIFATVRWSRTDAGSQTLDKIRLRLPVAGEIWLKYQIAMFSRMLSTLLTGGLPLVPSMETAGASMESRLIANAVIGASQVVREGQPLSASLEQTGVFPELALEMIEVGESTGALPAMLTSVAEFYEEDVQTALAAAMSLIEPVILIGMGLIVGFVLLSLYMPIFTLGSGGVGF